MSTEPSLDLSAETEYDEAFMSVLATISDLLVDSAEPDDLDDDARESIKLAMDEMATFILAELNFTIVSVLADGTITATVKPEGLPN